MCFFSGYASVVAQMAARVVVMYAGQVVEVAGVQDLFARPFHPYTQGLLRSIPRLGSRAAGEKKRLNEIKGTVPSLIDSVAGCKFADRCPQVFDYCRERMPELESVGGGQQARCCDHKFVVLVHFVFVIHGLGSGRAPAALVRIFGSMLDFADDLIASRPANEAAYSRFV